MSSRFSKIGSSTPRPNGTTGRLRMARLRNPAGGPNVHRSYHLRTEVLTDLGAAAFLSPLTSGSVRGSPPWMAALAASYSDAASIWRPMYPGIAADLMQRRESAALGQLRSFPAAYFTPGLDFVKAVDVLSARVRVGRVGSVETLDCCPGCHNTRFRYGCIRS